MQQSCHSLSLSLIFATPLPVSSPDRNQSYPLQMSPDLVSPLPKSLQWPPTAFAVGPILLTPDIA